MPYVMRDLSQQVNNSTENRENMELFASESDRMDYERERASDPMDEYRAVLRAEHFDPYENEQQFYCEEHDYADWDNECPYGHVAPELPAPELRTYLPEFEPPF